MNDRLEDMLRELDGDSSGSLTSDDWITERVNEQISTIRDTSNISDGSHTFGELYHHRAILSATIFNANRNVAWKSKRHDDGEMIKGFFIVGIETPEGQFTYHYPLEYWNYFKVKKMNYAPVWDGHSSKDVTRLFSLINDEDNFFG